MDQNTLQKHMDILGVGHDASVETIRAAWRLCVKHTHPDRNPGIPGHLILAVNEAYQALKDGIPSTPAQKQTASTAKPAPQETRSAARSAKQESFLPNVDFVFNAKKQADLAKRASAALAEFNYPRPERTLWQKLIGKKAPHCVRTPHKYLCMQHMIIILLDCKTLPGGNVFIPLPKLVVQNNRLKLTDSSYVAWREYDAGTSLELDPQANLAAKLLPPELSHYKIYLSTRSRTQHHQSSQ